MLIFKNNYTILYNETARKKTSPEEKSFEFKLIS